MGSVAFNTYEFIKSLTDAGIEEEQAAAISAGILRAHEVAELATKTDLRESQTQTDTKIGKVEANLDAKIDKVAATLDAKIDKVDAKIDKHVAEIKGELKLLKWMLGVTLAGVGSLIVMAVGILAKSFFGG